MMKAYLLITLIGALLAAIRLSAMDRSMSRSTGTPRHPSRNAA